MMFMLDTNICVAVIRRKHRPVIRRLTQQTPGTVSISSITVAELTYGVAKSTRPEQNRAALQQFLLPLDVLDFGLEAAEAYGDIRAYLERQGLPIGGMDILIGSHALSTNCILVTDNTREFARIPNLRVENWLVDSD